MSESAVSLEPPVVVETGEQPTASVIWLHGLGADGHDFEPIVPEIALPKDLAVRFVFPHAPYRPVTWNNGYVMRAWYDMTVTHEGFFQNLDHLREAEQTVHSLIAQEAARGIAPRRIVLAGFSQGAGVALYTGLRYPERLAGMLCLSSAIPAFDALLASIHAANAGTPIFLAHGDRDAVVPFAKGESAYQRLTAAGLGVEWHRYRMGHGVCPEEIADLSSWLGRVFI